MWQKKENEIRGVSDGVGGLRTTVVIVDGMVYISFPADESYEPSRKTGKTDSLAYINATLECETGKVHVEVMAYRHPVPGRERKYGA